MAAADTTALGSPKVGSVESLGATTLTPGQLVWRRFRKHRMAMIGAVGIGILILFVVIGSGILPESGANNIDLDSRLIRGSSKHSFCADPNRPVIFNPILLRGQTFALLALASG